MGPSRDDEEQEVGDRSVPVSFEGFFVAHHRELHAALVATLGDPEFARDAVAEAFARAFERWDTVGGYANPAGWVYRVALNWSRSRLRRLTREFRGRRIPELASPEHPDVDPRLAEALASLSVDHRAVVVLRYLLDWSVADTARALEIAPGTVKSRSSRALARLAEVLGDPVGG